MANVRTLTIGGVTYDLQDVVSGYAPAASPELTGIPTAPTAASGTNTTQIATTAFVQTALSGYSSSDIHVTQTNASSSSYTYWRPLVIGYSSNATEGFTPSTVTETAFTFQTLSVQPSTGTIRVGNLSLYNG